MAERMGSGQSRFLEDARKPDEIILHVGMTKAGSTSIQNVLDIRRHEVLAEGVLFPISCMSRRSPEEPSKTSGHLHLLRMLGKGTEGLLVREWNAATDARRLVLSMENLFLDQSDANLERLGAFFEGCRIRMVAVLRHQVDWVPARWRESVRGGKSEGRSLDRFVRDMLASGNLDYAARLDHVRRLIGANTVVTLDYGMLRQTGQLMETMLETFGLPRNLADTAGARSWNAMAETVEQSEADRRMNAAFDTMPKRDRRLWLEDNRAANSDGTKGVPRIPVSTSRCFEGAISSFNDRLSEDYMDGKTLTRDTRTGTVVPSEVIVQRKIRTALTGFPRMVEESRILGVAPPDLPKLYDAWGNADNIVHLGCGGLALLAATLPGKVIYAVEGDQKTAWRLQARADHFDLCSSVVTHAAPKCSVPLPNVTGEILLSGLLNLSSKPWFRRPDLVLVPVSFCDDGSLDRMERVIQEGRIMKLDLV